MDIKLLENPEEIRMDFMARFLLSWEDFQVFHRDWLAKNPGIDSNWYEHAYMWDKAGPGFQYASLKDALAFLRNRGDRVLFMAEKEEDTCYRGKEIVNFVAEADALPLASQIENEWFEDYRLSMQNMYDPDTFLPQDLYVFDRAMTWCAIFTHETTDWESEIDDPMKAAESRYCLIFKE